MHTNSKHFIKHGSEQFEADVLVQDITLAAHGEGGPK
jgi:hypothetical protein